MDKNISIYKNEPVEIPNYYSFDTKFKEALQIVDDIVLKNYVTKLRELDVIPLSDDELQRNIPENVRFFKITEMVYEKDEYSNY